MSAMIISQMTIALVTIVLVILYNKRICESIIRVCQKEKTILYVRKSSQSKLKIN